MRDAGKKSIAISSAEDVRAAAAKALADSKHPQAISLLLPMRKDDHWPIRMTVVQSLGGLGTPEAMEILQEMAKDENEHVSQEAKRYLSAKEKN